jgi:hypothetical protein
MSDDHIGPDKMYRPKEVAALEGICVALVYQRLAAGEYHPCFKDGDKLTLIAGSAILARRRAKLTPAKFKPAPPTPPSRFHTINRSSA